MIRLQTRILAGLLAAVVFVVGSTCVCALPTPASNFNADKPRCCSAPSPESPARDSPREHNACQHCGASAAIQRVECRLGPDTTPFVLPDPPATLPRPGPQAAPPAETRGNPATTNGRTLLTLRCALNE